MSHLELCELHEYFCESERDPRKVLFWFKLLFDQLLSHLGDVWSLLLLFKLYLSGNQQFHDWVGLRADQMLQISLIDCQSQGTLLAQI